MYIPNKKFDSIEISVFRGYNRNLKKIIHIKNVRDIYLALYNDETLLTNW